MFSFSTGRQHFELAPSISFGIKDLSRRLPDGGHHFRRRFDDGLRHRRPDQDLIQDPSHNPADLLHGFYFDNSVDTTAPPIPNVPSPKKTAVYLQGFAELSASAVVTRRRRYLRQRQHRIGEHRQLAARRSGFDDPKPRPAEAKCSMPRASCTRRRRSRSRWTPKSGRTLRCSATSWRASSLLDYDPPPAPTSSIPIGGASMSPDQHTLAARSVEDDRRARRSACNRSKTLRSRATATRSLADGIRVDYPNEIDLYIERKNNANTDYYNLIGVNGVVPDGEYINIIDPFRLFDDEGVPNPDACADEAGRDLGGGQQCRLPIRRGIGWIACHGAAGRRIRLEHAHRRHDGVRQFHPGRSNRLRRCSISATRRATTRPGSR